MKLFDTNLPQMYSKALFEERCFDLAPEHTDKIFDTLFTGSANLLKAYESTETPTAFVMKDLNGNLIAAAVVRYFASEEENNPGNFSLIWTFDQADIPENCKEISLDHPGAHTYFISVAGIKYGMKFKDTSCIISCLSYSMLQLKKWLDENAKEGSIVEISLDGIFQARVEVVNGEKCFAIEPEGEIKNIIKDDSAIEEK